jgi:hypothetical protein
MKQRVTACWRLPPAKASPPHAFMIKAIGAELAQAEAEAAFVARALAARTQVIATGQVIDGPAFADYLRCRVRGQSATRPSAKAITECVETKE